MTDRPSKDDELMVELANQLYYILRKSQRIGGAVDIDLGIYNRSSNRDELMAYVGTQLGKLMGQHIAGHICDKGHCIPTHLRRGADKRLIMEYTGQVRMIPEDHYRALCRAVEELALHLGIHTRDMLAEMYD
jgi:hypothetical protein